MDRVKNKKRNTARGIIFFENKVVMMHRIKKGREYYVIPGGGIEPGEESIEALKREIKEELSIKVESAFKVQTLFLKKGNQDYYIVKADPTHMKLGGEELQKSSAENYYELVLIKIDELKKYNIKPKEIVKTIRYFYEKEVNNEVE